jgi:hypothetical protein
MKKSPLLASSLLLALGTACSSVSPAGVELQLRLDAPAPTTAPTLTLPGGDRDQDAAKPAAPAEGGGDSAEEIGKKLANPASDVWAMFTEFDFASNGGRALASDKNSFSMIVQPVMPIPLTKNWKIITRPTLPIFADEPVPARGFHRRGGIGNLSIPMLLSPNKPVKLKNAGLVWGAGPTLSFPTSTTPSLGARVWEAGPTALLVRKTENTTLGIFPQYFWSYSEDDAPSTNRGSMLYFIWYELGNAWQVGTGPTVTYNNEATSGNEWNVPVGLSIAKTMKIGKRIVKFQFGFESSVVSQNDYGRESVIKLNVIPVIQDPFSSPIF